MCIYRYCRVVFGVKASPFLLNATIKHHLQNYENEFARKIASSLYVDDLTCGDKDDLKAFDLYKNAKYMFREGGLELRKWESNSEKLMENIKRSEQNMIENVTPNFVEDTETYADSVTNKVTPSNDVESKTLGILWDKGKDEFVFRFNEMCASSDKMKCTKRNVLAKIASIYDPIGYLSPIVVKLKALFQKICISKGDWDSLIDNELQKEWQLWINDAISTELRFTRCYLPSPILNINAFQIHTFFDSSKMAFAAVSYLRIKHDMGVTVQIIASKSRIAPTKLVSIPRLELLAGLLGAKLWKQISKISEFLISKVHMKEAIFGGMLR